MTRITPIPDRLSRLREDAELALSKLRTSGGQAAEALDMLGSLRQERQFPQLAALADGISRLDPGNAQARRYLAQALIELGLATAAIDVLKPLLRRLSASDPASFEAAGLMGRAYKQIFFDCADKTSAVAVEAIRHAIGWYARPFHSQPQLTWHGVNLVGMVMRTRRMGLRIARNVDPAQTAATILETLDGLAPNQRDAWYWAARAEACLGTGDWGGVESSLCAFVAAPEVGAFEIASTLRQLTELWDVQNWNRRGEDLVRILKARMLQADGGWLSLPASAIRDERSRSAPPDERLQAILGNEGTQTWKWYKTGLERASAVCSINRKLGDRIASGWLVRAGSVGIVPADELLVMTNYHAVNADRAEPGLRPESVEMVFELAAGDHRSNTYGIKDIVWSAAIDRHDCVLLRPDRPVCGIEPLPIATSLPQLGDSSRVYVIGYPGGRELAFSLRDNQLLDLERDPWKVEGVCRIHYRAPTEPGSSGSPVFDAEHWEVIALHRLGGRQGMQFLNGKPGTYPGGANEGVSVLSIASAIAAERATASSAAY